MATPGRLVNAKDATFEEKAQAVTLFWRYVSNGVPKMRAYQRAAEDTNTSSPAVRGWVATEQSEGIGALHPKERAGRPSNFSPGKKTCVEAVMKGTRGQANLRQVARCLEDECGVPFSTRTASSYVSQSGYDRCRKRQRTLLTEEHMRQRQKWCDKHFEDDFRSVAVGDEKLFLLKGGTGWQYVKTEEGEEPEYNLVTDKHHPAQVMVTAWVGRPNLEKGFHGKIALGLAYPEGDAWKQAQRSSKNRAKGTWLINQKATLNGQGYKQVMEEEFLPKIEEVRKQLGLKKMIIQDDNARPHTAAWTQHGLEASAKRRKCVRGDQPARSPELNVLDLYVWRVLECGVWHHRPKTIEELWEVLQRVWDEDLTAAKLECAFRLLTPVMSAITACNGGNTFRLPHSGIRKSMLADGWEI